MKRKKSLIFFLLQVTIGVSLLQAEQIANSCEDNVQTAQFKSADGFTSPLMMFGRLARNEKPTERSDEEVAFLVEKYGRRDGEKGFVEEENSDEEEQKEDSSGSDKPFSESTSGHPQETKKIDASSNSNFSDHIELSVSAFQRVAGLSRGVQSDTYNSLIEMLSQYQKEKNKSTEEALLFLSTLAKKTKEYLLIKENSLFKEAKKIHPNHKLVERASNRINACQLLLNGITAERLRLDNPKGSINYSPPVGFPIGERDISDCEPHFASGMSSRKVSLLTFNKKLPGQFIFKPVSDRPISSIQAGQLGFSEALIATGVTEREANLSGRALATYKIAKLIGCDLVPKVRPIIFRAKGNDEIGNVQEYIDGKELYKERMIHVFQDELTQFFRSVEEGEEYLAEVATGITDIQLGWKLFFIASGHLEEVSLESPILEKGEKISFERALALAKERKLFFQRSELYEVNSEIDFSDPHIQKSLSNLQLLHFITGEQDPNLRNFTFKKNADGHWKAYSFDHDLSFPRDFISIDDDAIEARRYGKLAKHILQRPILIDEEMGESILAIIPEDIEKVLEGTRLTTAEIEATKSRLVELQDYIRKEKEAGGYVRNPTGDLTDENVLVWGKETYEILKKFPKRNYLAKMLEAKEQKEKELQAISAQRNQVVEEEPKSIEPEKFDNGLEAHYVPFLMEAINNKPQTSSISSLLDDSGSENSEDKAFEREISHQTMESIFWMPLHNFREAIEQFGATTYEELKNKLAALNKSSFFSLLSLMPSSSISEEVEKLIFHNNTLRLRAEKKGEEARSFFTQLIENKISLASHEDPWKEALKKFDEAQSDWEETIQALEAEEHSLSYELYSLRQIDFQKAKNQQERIAVEFLWMQLYEAEHCAKLDEKKIEKAQQAWRILASHLTGSFQDSSKIWEQQFKIAESLTNHFTNLFPYWLKAIKIRYKSIASRSTSQSRSIDSRDEMAAWDDLLNRVSLTESLNTNYHDRAGQLLWSNVIQEIGFQKLCARAQETSNNVVLLQEEIAKLAESKIVQTTSHIAKFSRFGYPMIHTQLINITGVDHEKLNDLSCFWDDLKKKTQLEQQSWSAVFEAANKLSINKKLKNEKSLQHYNEASHIASLFFQAQQLELLGNQAIKNFSNLNLSRASSPFLAPNHKSEEIPSIVYAHRFEKTINNFSIDNISFELKKAQDLCNRLIEVMSTSALPESWKPTFPSEKLYRWDERLEEVGHVGGEYLVVDFYREEIMKAFLNQINDFPNAIQFQTHLEEMLLNGASHEFKNKWNQTYQKIKTLKKELCYTLDQLALVRGLGDGYTFQE